MSFTTRGFAGRRRGPDDQLPPGQTLFENWPVLTAGPTPYVDTETWDFAILDETGTEHHWNWEQFLALGAEDITVDIHCVTHWSKLDMAWRGVSLDKLFENVETSHDYVMAHSYGGYTTNVPLEDLLDGKAWIATEAEGAPLDAEHGGPASSHPASVLLEEREMGPCADDDADERPWVLGAERLSHLR
jgi:DMSO/TMAO reductase YedYZ molybdopterin-dependent catalytic subunit